ncbi:MAG: FtsX-like permease family protein [Candidatus Geothermarchaeales archaeon]
MAPPKERLAGLPRVIGMFAASKVIFRRRGRALIFLFVVALATSMIISPGVATELTSQKVVDTLVESAVPHILYRAKMKGDPQGNLETISSVLSEIDEVTEHASLTLLSRPPSILSFFDDERRVYMEIETSLVEEDVEWRILGLQLIAGGFGEDPLDVVLSDYVAEQLDVQLGDIITLRFDLSDSLPNGAEGSTVDLEVTVSGLVQGSTGIAGLYPEVVRGPFVEFGTQFAGPFGGLFFKTGVLDALLERYPELSEIMGFDVLEPFYETYIYLDADFITVFDLQSSREKLEEVEDQITQKLQTVSLTSGYTQNNLASRLRSAEGQIASRTYMIYVVSLPFLALSWYLASITTELSVTEARRDIGLMKARGSSDRKVTLGLTLSYLVLALAGGLLGLFGGILVSASNASLPLQQLLTYTFQTLTAVDSLMLTLGLASVIAVTVMWRKRSLIGSITPTEASRVYLPEEVEHRWRPSRLFLAMFALGTLKMAEWISGVDPRNFIFQPGQPFIIMLLGSIYLFLSSVLNVLAPLFFIYTTVTIATNSRRVLLAISRVVLRPLLRGLSGVTSNFVVRNPRRVVKAAFLAAFILAIMVFSSGLVSSVLDHQTRQLRARVGADGAITLIDATIDPLTLESSLVGGLEKLDGIEALAYIYQVNAPYFEVRGAQGEHFPSQSLWAVDPERLLEATFLEDDMVTEGKESFLRLKEEGTVIVQGELAPEYGVDVGDSLSLLDANGSQLANLRVVATLNYGFGGLGWGYMVISPQTAATVMTASSPTEMNIYVDVAEGFDIEKTIRGATDWLDEAGVNVVDVRTIESEKRYYANQALEDTAGWLSFFSTYGVAVASIGLAMLTTVYARDHLWELAVMRARGMSRRNVLTFTYGSILPVLLISLLVGLTVALISLYGWIRWLQAPFQFQSFQLPYRLVFSAQDLLLFSMVILVFVLTPLLSAIYVLRHRVVEVMRGR